MRLTTCHGLELIKRNRVDLEKFVCRTIELKIEGLMNIFMSASNSLVPACLRSYVKKRNSGHRVNIIQLKVPYYPYCTTTRVLMDFPNTSRCTRWSDFT
jgi:hypothetical protein